MNRRRALMSAASSGPAPVHGTWEDLFARIADGTYATAYSVGEILPLDLGTEGVVNAQIVAFNSDDKADNSGKTKVSFITQNGCSNNRTWNPSLTPSSAPYNEGTGSVGGWSKCTLRSFLINTILTKIPSEISNRIVSVKKYSRYFDTSGTAVRNGTSDENIWAPSAYELGLSLSTTESSGVQYSGVFSSANARIKQKNGGSAAVYWTRTAGNGSSTISMVKESGERAVTGNPTSGRMVVFGFCID